MSSATFCRLRFIFRIRESERSSEGVQLREARKEKNFKIMNICSAPWSYARRLEPRVKNTHTHTHIYICIYIYIYIYAGLKETALWAGLKETAPWAGLKETALWALDLFLWSFRVKQTVKQTAGQR